MDVGRVAMLREVLGTTSFMDDARGLARVLRRPAASPGSLLLVGTETHEPWHLTAHLDDEARYSGIPELAPTLVRWQAPAGAPPHLAVTMERLEACLLYTSDAADDLLCVDLGGRRIIKKKKKNRIKK